MAQITRITSEALQATIRRLLPSQQGFGEDLEAVNLIQPIIDLTPTAEGTVLRQDLQTAVDFATTQVSASTQTTIVSTAGFYKLYIQVDNTDASLNRTSTINISDGLSSKVAINVITEPGITTFDPYIVFLRPGDSAIAVPGTNCNVFVTYRQVADVTGNLTPPNDFVFE